MHIPFQFILLTSLTPQIILTYSHMSCASNCYQVHSKVISVNTSIFLLVYSRLLFEQWWWKGLGELWICRIMLPSRMLKGGLKFPMGNTITKQKQRSERYLWSGIHRAKKEVGKGNKMTSDILVWAKRKLGSYKSFIEDFFFFIALTS